MDSIIKLENVSFYYPESTEPVFENLSIELGPGISSLIGQNGTGKSTFLLLAGGTVLPQLGDVSILGQNTKELREVVKRHELVSFVFQNMEFDSDESIGDLLEYVFQNGFLKDVKPDFVRELVKIFELEKCLGRKTQEVSKGELQRTILAFSLLYGSRILMMDEPIFALENYQKEKAMDYLCHYSREHGIHLFFSLHELELTEKYAENILLFYKNDKLEYGPKADVFDKSKIEEAYQVPYFMLKQKEALFREQLEVQYDSDKSES